MILKKCHREKKLRFPLSKRKYKNMLSRQNLKLSGGGLWDTDNLT